MLVLSRKLNQSIRIGGNVTVTINAVRGEKVSLGIEAPPEISVDREERYLMKIAALEAENAQLRKQLDHAA